VPLARQDLLGYLDTQFAALADATLPSNQVSWEMRYGPAADQALRALGVPQATLATATVADDQTPDAIALAEYYSLQRFARALALQVDVTLDAPVSGKKRSQAFAQVNALLAQARAELTARGYLGQGWDMQRLELDYIEPAIDF